MKTREELEKMFDELDKYDFIQYEENWLDASYSKVNIDKIKQFIFESIIPEILKSVIPEEKEGYDDHTTIYNNCIYHTRQKAKELYWIDL
jgi:hypothetical protein